MKDNSVERISNKEISPGYLRQQVSIKVNYLTDALKKEGMEVNPLKFLLMDYYFDNHKMYEC